MGHVRTAGSAFVNAAATVGTIPIPNAVTVGHTIVGGVVWESAASAVPTITSIVDSRGNTYASVAAINNGATVSQIIFYGTMTTALQAGDSITVTIGSSRSRWALVVDQFDDLTTSPLDRSATNAPAASASLASGTTAATTAANELVYCVFGFGQGRTTTIPSGWSGGSIVESTAASANRALQATWRYVTATGTQAGTLTISSSSTYTGNIATFKAGSPPPPTSAIHIRNGGVFVEADPYVMSGGAWVPAVAHVLNGGAWQTI